MAEANPVFSMCDNFIFDPELHYAQVLAEARKDKQRHDFRCPPLVEDVSCFSRPHFKAAELEKSLQDLKKSRSWKKSIFFWKKSKRNDKGVCSTEVKNGAPKRPGFISRSGPIYMNNVEHSSRPSRSSGPSSGPLSGTLTPTTKDEGAHIPYVSLKKPQQKSCASPSSLIYWVT